MVSGDFDGLEDRRRSRVSFHDEVIEYQFHDNHTGEDSSGASTDELCDSLSSYHLDPPDESEDKNGMKSHKRPSEGNDTYISAASSGTEPASMNHTRGRPRENSRRSSGSIGSKSFSSCQHRAVCRESRKKKPSPNNQNICTSSSSRNNCKETSRKSSSKRCARTFSSSQKRAAPDERRPSASSLPGMQTSGRDVSARTDPQHIPRDGSTKSLSSCQQPMLHDESRRQKTEHTNDQRDAGIAHSTRGRSRDIPRELSGSGSSRSSSSSWQQPTFIDGLRRPESHSPQYQHDSFNQQAPAVPPAAPPRPSHLFRGNRISNGNIHSKRRQQPSSLPKKPSKQTSSATIGPRITPRIHPEPSRQLPQPDGPQSLVKNYADESNTRKSSCSRGNGSDSSTSSSRCRRHDRPRGRKPPMRSNSLEDTADLSAVDDAGSSDSIDSAHELVSPYPLASAHQEQKVPQKREMPPQLSSNVSLSTQIMDPNNAAPSSAVVSSDFAEGSCNEQNLFRLLQEMQEENNRLRASKNAAETQATNLRREISILQNKLKERDIVIGELNSEVEKVSKDFVVLNSQYSEAMEMVDIAGKKLKKTTEENVTIKKTMEIFMSAHLDEKRLKMQNEVNPPSCGKSMEREGNDNRETISLKKRIRKKFGKLSPFAKWHEESPDLLHFKIQDQSDDKVDENDGKNQGTSASPTRMLRDDSYGGGSTEGDDSLDSVSLDSYQQNEGSSIVPAIGVLADATNHDMY